MTIKNCFIPCAGLGSRMGPVGRVIPKPLWPIFEKSMLEVQVAFVKSLGFEQLFANTHHQSAKINKVNKTNDLGLNLLFEEELLGNGGNLHNLKKLHPEVSQAFIANPDVFLLLSKRDWARFFDQARTNTNLVLMPCTSHYNEVHITDKGEFLKVSPPPTNGEEYFTYTGVSLVDLNGFPYVADKSSFFETVVNTKIGKVKTFTPLDPFEYWDFGTLELYLSNIEKILSTKSGLFWDFLIENELVYNSAIDGDSYKSLSGLFKKDHGKSASSLSISIREEGAEFNLL